MSTPKSIRPMGGLLLITMSDGVKLLAYPTGSKLWLVNQVTEPPIDPGPGEGGSGLINPWGPLRPGEVDGWESHASYSRGGSDWGLAYGTILLAPAAGTITNLGNTDAAGLKTMLVFDTSYPRKLPASTTLMNGSYRENPTAPAVAFMAQHLSAQGYEGHVEQGQPFCVSGNSAGPGSTGDTHLHAHLLAGAAIAADRLDFMKFV